MGTKTKYPFIHMIAVLLTPMIFACAHATTEESLDGYGGTTNLNPNAEATVVEGGLTEPQAVTSIPLEAGIAEATDKEVAAAQKAVVKDRRTHARIQTPFVRPAKTARKVLKRVVVAAAPTAMVESPNQTVTRNGSTLNRYYFTRSGDTPEKLSKLFYGDENRAAELVEWNGAASEWEAGKLIYFRSAKTPDDTTLLSYYFEAGVPTESVTLAAGQNLMSIAKERYGSGDSWREIAVLNGLRKGAGPEAGATLKVYPSSLTKEEAVPLVAQMDPKSAKEAKMASAQIASFIQNNPLIVACTFVALVLLGAFLYMQRKRYRSRFDF